MTSPNRLHAALALALLFASGPSCTYPATAVSVTLGSDIAPNRFHAIRAFVRHGTTPARAGETPNHEWHTDTLDGGSFLPASFTVVPGPGDPRDVHVSLVIEADIDVASGGGVPVTIRRIARFATTPRVTTEVGLWLASRCGDLTTGCTTVSDPSACTVSARCEEQGLTCGDNGTCSSPDVMPHPPVGLPEAGPDTVTLADAAVDDALDVVPDVVTAPDPVRPQIAMGQYHACAIDPSRNVRCWGSNSAGQLGDTSALVRTAPIATPVVDRAIAVAVGREFSCALRDDGTVHCWGSNRLGQLGDGTIASRAQPAPVSNVSNAVAIAAGQEYACAVLASGSVVCWGNGSLGHLGNGASNVESRPVSVAGLTDAAGVIATTFGHTCAARRDGTAVCWGENTSQQLGADPAMSIGDTSEVPVAVAGLADVVVLAAGHEHTCALRRDASIACWGRNDFGQRGPAAVPAPPAPAQFTIVDGLGGPAAGVATGLGFTCALLVDGSVRCFGLNDSYVVSNGLQRAVPTPTTIAIPRTADSIAAGGLSACVHDATGAISCWGSDTFRQLGDNRPFVGNATASTAMLTGATRLALGAGHACAQTASGMQCWGANNYAQLGTVGPSPSSPRPLGVTDAVQFVLGETSTLVRDATGRVRTWGVAAAPVPDGMTFPLPAAADEVTANGLHGCGRNGDTVWCWGTNSRGELGDGTTTDRNTATPVDLQGATVVQIAAGIFSTCALTGPVGARSVMCWGANESGQLGDGTTTEQHLPVMSMMSGDVVEITAGLSHTCARRSTGAVSCWGTNVDGELGNGSTVRQSLSPVTVSGLTDAVQISAGDRFTCAVRTTGDAVCWGANGGGELGVAGMASASAPVAMTAVTTHDITAIGTGYGFACALRSTGAVQCWGSPLDGRLGDGTAFTTTPVAVANWP